MGALWSGQKQADMSGSVTEPSDDEMKERVEKQTRRGVNV